MENNFESVLTAIDLEYIHSEEFIAKFGDWEKAKRLEKLKNSDSLDLGSAVIVDGIDFLPQIESARAVGDIRTLRKIGVSIGKNVISKLKREQGISCDKEPAKLYNRDRSLSILFPASGVRETNEHNILDEGHIESIAYIPKIIENAIYIGREPNEDNKRPDIVRFEYFATGIAFKGKNYTCKSVFGITKKGEIFYDQSVSGIEKGILVDFILGKNKPQQRVPSNRKGEAGDTEGAFNPINCQDNSNRYYDKRLLSVCQLPQLQFLDEKFEPTKFAIEMVRKELLYIEKRGQEYVMTEKKLTP